MPNISARGRDFWPLVLTKREASHAVTLQFIHHHPRYVFTSFPFPGLGEEWNVTSITAIKCQERRRTKQKVALRGRREGGLMGRRGKKLIENSAFSKNWVTQCCVPFLASAYRGFGQQAVT